MTPIVWQEAPLGKQHDRKAFDCDDTDLNDYLQRYARQNHESGGAKCFVAVPENEPSKILGFYTLSPVSLEFDRVPEIAKKGLGRYEVIGFRLGRLGVDKSVAGRGLGGALTLRAADRCLRVAEEVGGVVLLIDAKSDKAAKWYEGYGAVPLKDAPLSLVLPLATAAKALQKVAIDK